MRLSTNTIYSSGTNGLLRQSADLFRTQQQLSTGRRVLSPADDPVASARALEIEQSKALNDQYAVNRRDANSALGFAESQLSTATDILAAIRQRAVQGGSTAVLTDTDRKAIATDLRAMHAELMGLANSQDAFGDYLFAGYQSTSPPFAGSVEAGVSYLGDDGQRHAQVGSNRQIAIGDPGSDIFMRIPDGNGRFSLTPALSNSGTAVADSGAVYDVSAWNSASNPGDFDIVFSNTGGSTTYDIIDNTTGHSLLTGAAPGAAPYPRAWVEGDAIRLSSNGGLEPPFDFGASFSVAGQPGEGDRINLGISTSQSVFETVSDLIKAFEQPADGNPAAITRLNHSVASALSNLDQATDRVTSAQARIGARISEMEALDSLGEETNIQFETALSGLRDLNYTEAISRLTQQQAYLEAAQMSFLKVSGLSLFNYLGA
jgi:flagellar hook-associated protein 3 FlgL